METSHSAIENGAGTKPEADIFLKDGEIIDPGQGINGKGSIAIKDSKIQAIGPGLASDRAKVVLDMRGKILVAGPDRCSLSPGCGFFLVGRSPG